MTPTADKTNAPSAKMDSTPRSASTGAFCPSLCGRSRLRSRCGRINVKVILIVVGIVVVLGVGAFVARNVRRKILAERDFAAGNAAYDRQDWKEAGKRFQEYLGRRPEDLEILRKYAESLLATEPLEQRGIARAAGAYRELLRLAPDDAEVCEELAKLYIYIGNFGELSYIAQRRLEQDPNDPRAVIWQARALLVDAADKEKTEKAREMLVSLRNRLVNDERGKHPEYVEACRMLCQIEFRVNKGRENTPEVHAKAMTWLDRAIEYDPTSAETLIYRSILWRAYPASDDKTRQKAIIKSSQDDLQQAQDVKTDDPRIDLSLSRQWMLHGKLVDAQQSLQSVKDVPPAVIKKYFIRASDWTIERFLQTAELALRQGKPAEAEPEAEKMLQAITDRDQRLAILPPVVRLYLAGDKADKARKHLDEYLELRKVLQLTDDREGSVAVLQAGVASAEGRPEEIIRLLEPMSSGGRVTPMAMRLLTWAYDQGAGDHRRQTVETLQAYVRERPEDGQMWLLLARKQLLAGQWSQAAVAARKAEELDRDNNLDIKLIRIEAEIRHASEDLTANADSLRKLSGELSKLQAANSKKAAIRALAAEIDLANRDPEAAERRLKQAISQCDETLGIELGLARLLASQGRSDEAVKICSAACDRLPRSRPAWTALADLHRSAGNLKEAQTVLDRGLQAVDASDRTHLARALAVIELLQNNRAAGRKRLEDLAQQDPRDVSSRSLLLNLPEVIGDAELAERLLADIHKVRGDSSLLWRRHRVRLWLAGDKWRSGQDKVIKTLEQWMFQNPEWSFPSLMLARLHLRLGKALQAEKVCQKALSLNPAAVEVADFLVTMLTQQKRHAEAAAVLETLKAPLRIRNTLRLRVSLAEGGTETSIRELTLRVADNPRDVSALVLLARLVYQRDRDAKRAMAHLDEAAKVQPDSTTVAWLQATILKNEGQAKQARDLLDKLVKRSGSLGAHQLRGAFLREIGDIQAAEKDYIHLTTIEPRSDGYQILASFYERTNRINDAVRTLTEGLKGDSKNAGIRFRLVHLLMRRRGKGDLVRAETLVSSLEKELGETPDVLFARASLVIAQRGTGFLKKAREPLQRLVELEPAQVRGYLALIQIALAAQDPTQAKAIAIRGLEANPNHTQLLLAQAQAEMALKNSDAAADLLRKVIRTSPANTGALAMLTAIAIESKKPEAMSEALALARRAAAANTADYRLPLTAAAILRAMEKPADAVSELDRYAKTPAGKTSIPVLISLAEISRTAGKTDDWNRWVLQAETAAPQHPAVLIERLLGLAAQNKHDEMISRMAAYRQGKQVDLSVLQAGAAVLLSSESPACRKEAIKLYERVLAVTPDSLPVQLNLALAVNKTGDLDRAEAIYREILKTQPRSPLALNGLAWMLATNRKDYKAALPLIDKAAELTPNSSHVRDTRGVILSNLPGRLGDARKDFEKCVELAAPNSARHAKALLQLGRICGKLNDHTATRKHLAEALQIDAKNKVLTDEQRREIAEILKNLPAKST